MSGKASVGAGGRAQAGAARQNRLSARRRRRRPMASAAEQVPQAAQAVAHAGLLLVLLRRLGGLAVRRFALGAAAQALGAHVVAEVGVLAVAHGGVAAPRAVLGGEGPGLLRALTGQEGAVVDRICAATQLLHPLGAEVGHDLVAVGGLGPVAGLLDH